MTRTIHYKIEAQHHGWTIGTFLKEKEYSRAVVIELKKTPIGIKKNGVWAGVNEVLNAGDVLDICLVEEMGSENIVPTKLELEVLHEDDDLLVVSKPYDTPIHPSINNYDNTLANGVTYYCQQQGDPYTFRCINRLDRDTTGVTIIAKNQISASILSKSMKERGLTRTYIAFVEGITPEFGTIDLPIGREEGTIIKRKIDHVEGKRAVTHYCRLDVIEIDENKVSVVALQLETGRTHQIRVHMTALGHPLLGDFLYNEDNHILTRQGLHAAECGFYHPITGEYMRIGATLPEDMQKLMVGAVGDKYHGSDLLDQLRMIDWEMIRDKEHDRVFRA